MFSFLKTVVIGICLLIGAGIWAMNATSFEYQAGPSNSEVSLYYEDTGEERISDDKAVEIALNEAGVKEEDDKEYTVIHGTSVEFNVECYDVTVTAGNQEYNYIIDAHDGTVLKAETNTENA